MFSAGLVGVLRTGPVGGCSAGSVDVYVKCRVTGSVYSAGSVGVYSVGSVGVCSAWSVGVYIQYRVSGRVQCRVSGRVYSVGSVPVRYSPMGQCPDRVEEQRRCELPSLAGLRDHRYTALTAAGTEYVRCRLQKIFHFVHFCYAEFRRCL